MLNSARAPFFKHIVFYGKKPHPEIITMNNHDDHGVCGIIQDVLTRFPHYSGYLFLNDDSITHFLNHLPLNLEKIWHVNFNDAKISNGSAIHYTNIFIQKSRSSL
jgi:hypothetical protein